MSEIFFDEKIEKPLVILEVSNRLQLLQIDTIFWSVGVRLEETTIDEIFEEDDDMQSENYILLLELF